MHPIIYFHSTLPSVHTHWRFASSTSQHALNASIDACTSAFRSDWVIIADTFHFRQTEVVRSLKERDIGALCWAITLRLLRGRARALQRVRLSSWSFCIGLYDCVLAFVVLPLLMRSADRRTSTFSIMYSHKRLHISVGQELPELCRRCSNDTVVSCFLDTDSPLRRARCHLLELERLN